MDFWSLFFNLILIAALMLFIYLAYPILTKNFLTNHSGKWNMLTAIVGIAAFAGLIALSFYDPMFDPLILYPFNYYACVFFGAWILVCFITNGIAQFFIR